MSACAARRRDRQPVEPDVFLLPLIALLISHDAIVGEMERGTMLLLLSYPVGRWQVLLGKFVGHLAILAFATLLATAPRRSRSRSPERRSMSRASAFGIDARLLDPARRASSSRSAI